MLPPPIDNKYYSKNIRCNKNIIQILTIHGKLILLFAIALSCFISTQAFAGDCSEIANNREWIEGINKLQEYYKAENYDAIIETAKPLFQICGDSPTLLFFTGTAIEKKGETERALIYYTKASENLTAIATNVSVSKSIWYKRYELEHPDRTEDAVAAQNAKIAELEQQQLINSTNTSLDESKKFETILWTGVGVGIAGVALIGTGAGVAASVQKGDLIRPKDGKLGIAPKFTTGWALIGTGIGMTVAGAVMAGIGGYHYSKAKSDAVMTFNASPMSASFAMTF